MGASIAESSSLIESTQAAAELVGANSSAGNAAVADSGSGLLASLTERSEAGIALNAFDSLS